MSRMLLTGMSLLLVISVSYAGDGRLAVVGDAAALLSGATEVTDAGPLPPAAISREIGQMPGWPITVPTHAQLKPMRGAVLADLNNDGNLEIIVGTTDKRIFAWDYTGALLPGFPITLNYWVQYPPTVGDIDGDGWLEIVAGTRGPTTGGRLYVIDHLGQVRPNWPLNINNRNISCSPTIYDLDGDGQMEIIVGENINPGKIHIFRPDATEWTTGWPFVLDHVPAVTPAVADIDRDGQPEIVVCSYNSLYALHRDGTLLAGFPLQLPGAKFSYQSPALVDLDLDGYREIVVGAHSDAPGCYVYRYDGTAYPGWPHLVENWSYCPPAVTDLEGDGVLEIVFGQAAGSVPPTNCFWVWDANGIVKPGFPYVSDHGGGSEGAITVADVNGDGRMEIFTDHNMTDGTNGWLYGVDAQGANLPGFPLRPRGFTYMNGAAIGDVDNDGHYELAVMSYSDTTADVNLYTLPDTYRRTSREWPTYHGNAARQGAYSAVRVAGDLNCDDAVDFLDINPFVLVLTDVPEYQQAYPRCNAQNGDCNGDGRVDFVDINAFVNLLTS